MLQWNIPPTSSGSKSKLHAFLLGLCPDPEDGGSMSLKCWTTRIHSTQVTIARNSNSTISDTVFIKRIHTVNFKLITGKSVW